MEFAKSGNKSQRTNNDDIIWIDDEPSELHNDNFRAHFSKGQGSSKSGFRNAAKDSTPHSYWGRGYGPHTPGAPPEHKNISFLLQCGVLKTTLKGLPHVLLNLMGPNYCGVCAQTLDNFDMACLHYGTKNHVKNQKRWLVQQAKVGSQRPKEIPMRARELYCELCDVYITSKVHAASHYAGRPHRAIVEGLRVPRNPFLLQKNMQGRVEKLIRRELKCLKPIDKNAETEKLKKNAKVVSPELYCKICETSVTNMEQMTMHLNGKKHLKKEKNHIFKMMQGEIGDGKEKSQAAPANDTDHDASEDEDFDWGDGSGPWDDDPQ